jgi:hypothetical protein
MNQEEIIITKKLAKQGGNVLLIIPKHLHPFLEKGDLVSVKINKLVHKND